MDRGLLYGGFSDDSGGCIEMKSGAKAYLNEVMIAGNGADTFLKTHGYGGAVWMRANNVLEMKSSIIEGNFAASHGGAIYVDGAGCRIKLDPYSQINYNYSRGSGGAVYVDDDYCYINGESTMHISRHGDEDFSMSRMDYNRANGGYGGAIYVNNNYFTDYPGAIAGFSMRGNSSNDDGGAVYLHRKKYKVANCIFDGNKAGKRGGAVYVDVADIGLDNVEIKGNEAGKNGGGVYLSPDGTGFSGRVVVKDNKNGNIYIEKGDKADFASLSGGSEVFITCENTEDGRVISSKPGTFKEGYFNCDNSSYHLEWNNSGDRNLVLKSGAKKSSGLDYTELDGKYRRECGNAGFTYTPVSTAADALADAAGQSVLMGYASSPSHTDEEKDIVNKYFYSDGYFFEDPKVYNPHLATFTMNMAMASADSNYESHDDYRNKFANIKNLFLGIGISENAIFVNDWYIRKPTDDSIGCAIGSKTIKGKSTGAEYSLVAVAIRSYNYESEWASNMTIGGKKERYAEHKGFNSAKRQVLTSIENYIKDYGLSNDLKTGKVRFLVTGFSRGSATTNLVSKELVDRYVAGDASDPEADPYEKPKKGTKYEEYKGKENRVYAYCQAVPAGGVEERDFGLNSTDSGRYYCIHNVVNKVDLTPMVAPSNMGFKRYGVDHYVPGYPAGTQGLAVRKVTLTAEDDDSTPKKSDLTIFFDGKADGKDSWQNKDWWVGTPLYNDQRKKMLSQLKMVNEEVSFEDYFHMAAMAFISSSPGPYEIDKGYKNLEEFMPAFYNRLTNTYKVLYYLPGSDKNLNMSRNRYSNYQLREKKSDWKGVTSEKAIRETMMLLLSKTPSEKANLTAALTGVIGKFSYVFSTEKTLKNLHTQLLSSTKGWDGLSDSDQKVWLDTFWDKMNNTSDGSMGLKDAMNDEELSRFKSDFSTILEIALRFANQDYNDTAGTFNTGDVAQHLGTMAYNMQAILHGHVPEIALAWHRSYDSYYDNEVDKAYSFKSYSGKPASPVASLSSGREYAGNQLLEFDYNIDFNCLYTIKKTDEQGKTYAEMDGKKLFLYQPGQGLELCRAGHAEANAIDQCARRGTSCEGSTLYVTTQPCVFCCIHIIQSGIKKVIFKGEYPTGLGLQLLKESGVEYMKYEDALADETSRLEEKHELEMERVRDFLKDPEPY